MKIAHQLKCSPMFKGNRLNNNLSACADLDWRGLVGLCQENVHGEWQEILLTRQQWDAIVQFVSDHKEH